MATRTYPEIPPPDVVVIIETPTESPTIVPAVLPPVLVGPCYEIVEILNSDGSTNEDARVYTPASVTSQELDLAVALVLGAVPDFTIAVDNGPAYTVKLSTIATPTLPADVVSYINGLSVPGLTAEILPGATGKGYIHIRTAAGEGHTIELEGVDSTVTTVLGGEFHDIDKEGSADYNQWFVDLVPQNFPNPNDLDTDQLVYDPDDIDVYMDIGSALSALSDDSAIERYGTAQMEFVDDGDGDGVSPILRIYEVKAGGPNAVPTATSVLGLLSADLNSAAAICQLTCQANAINLTVDGTFRISIDGSQIQDVELTSGMTPAQVVVEVNKYFSHAAFAHAGGAAPFVIESYLKGSEGSLYIQPATSGNDLQILKDMGIVENIPVPTFDDSGYHFGDWFPVKRQDELVIGGQSYGTVTKVFSRVAGPPTYTDVKLDTEWPESTFILPATQRFFFRSKVLPAALPDPANTYPTPELYISGDGDVHIKHNILRDIYGEPMFPGSGELYLGYKALRQDVSADAETPRMIVIADDDDIEAELGEIRVDNPLAFAAWLTKNLGCPDRQVYALGISETSDDLPDGTLDAYTSAFQYLENWEVYTLVALSQELSVHQLAQVHVDTQSLPDNKAERKYFGTIDRPSRAPDTVAISGTEGNTTGVTNEFNSAKPGLTQALDDLGVDPGNLDPGAATDAEEVFLDIEQDAQNYRVKSISGQLITIVPATGSPSWNADGFYATSWPYGPSNPLINESWSLKVRGAELTKADGSPDKDAIAKAIADICYGFQDWRVNIGYPGEAVITDPNGLEQAVPSYYLAAITAGQIAQFAPQQPYTNVRVPGVQSVKGSSDFFSKDQLNIIAGGGCWIWYQETPSSAVQVRHQLTTDTSTKTKRESSLLHALDYAAKFIRTNVRPMLGKFNITPELVDQLGMTIDGCCSYLHEDLKVFNNCTYSGLRIVDVDEIEVVLEADPKYPLNKVTVRIRI